MLLKKADKSPDAFWQEYEEKINEKVLARCLGQYLSGWEEFDSQGWKSIWGLAIVSSGGFRFHHFPHISWFESFTSFTGREAPKEKTFLVQKEKIISAQLIEESRWWKKLLAPSLPHIIIHYRDAAENERQLLLETHTSSKELIAKLTEISLDNQITDGKLTDSQLIDSQLTDSTST